MPGVAAQAATAGAMPRQYVQGEFSGARLPYTWALPDGEVLFAGVGDRQDRMAIVRHPDASDYVLEVPVSHGRFGIHIDDACWELDGPMFADCVQLVWRDETAAEKDQRRIRRDDPSWSEIRRARSDAVDLTIEQIEAASNAAMQQHREWSRNHPFSPRPKRFRCVQLPPALRQTHRQSTLPRAAMLDGDVDATASYLYAMRGGDWRAASGLFDATMQDMDWQSAQALVAWLMHHEVPAAYQHLADLMLAVHSYNGNRPDVDAIAQINQLRWHAAMLGDPMAQHVLGRVLRRDEPHSRLGDTLMQCAARQDPQLRDD